MKTKLEELKALGVQEPVESAEEFLLRNLSDHNASVNELQTIYLHGERDIKCFTNILEEYASFRVAQALKK